MKLKKTTMMLAVAGVLFTGEDSNATNWLELQGTEGPNSGRVKVWGFLQPTYQNDFSDISSFTAAAPPPEPTRIGPNLENQSQFQLLRARIGVRGTPIPGDRRLNYFILSDFGHNGATDGGPLSERTPVRLMDASVTLNYIPHARIRAGLFKTPGSEELLQGIVSLDYINFTWVGNQLLLERYGKLATPSTAGGGYVFDSSFGAARDTGIQIFDWFHTGNWVHTYAVMVGNGHGLAPGQNMYRGQNTPGKDSYLYWSSERVYGGKGPFQEGWKTYVWWQSGQRYFDATDDGNAYNGMKHDRTRRGIGTRYRKSAWRAAAEYITGKGMIFQGPEKPNFSIGPYSDLEGSSNGYYLDLGYYLPNTKWEIDLRYDVYNRSKDNPYIAAEFKGTTIGVQYHLSRTSRVTINYEIRSASPTGSTPFPILSTALDAIGNRLSMQLTTIF